MMPTTEELTATVEALREEIERVRDKGFRSGSAPRGTFTVDTVEGFTHCQDPFCRNQDFQTPATSQREVMTQSNRQRDPASDWGAAGCAPAEAIENSYERFFWTDQASYVCPTCKQPTLQFSMQERPKYERLSQASPLELLQRKREGLSKSPEEVLSEANESRLAEGSELQQMKDQLVKQQAMLSFMLGQTSGTPVSMPPELMDMLDGTTTAPEPEEPAATKPGVKGYRKRANGWEALLYRTESETGKQRSLGTFPTVEEAVAAREAALNQGQGDD